MSHPWKVVLIVAGSLLALLIVASGAFTWWFLSPSTWKNVQNIGGDWIVVEVRSPIAESGGSDPRIERRHGGERTAVGSAHFPYKYMGDDCLLFTDGYANLIRAACGDTAPINVLRTRDFHEEPEVHWQKLEDAVRTDPLSLNGTVIPWSEIKQHARAGKSFEIAPAKAAE